MQLNCLCFDSDEGLTDGCCSGLTTEKTVGENVAFKDVLYLKSDGKFWKADASTGSTTIGLMMVASETISISATGTFIKQGKLTTTGLITGSIYYLSTTTGEITSTAPTASGEFVRILGYALSTTILLFDPSQDYIEII